MLKKISILLTILIMQCAAFADEIYTSNYDGVYIFKVPLKTYADKIKPYVSEKLKTTSDLFKEGNYELVVNGGFFDTVTGEEISYVKIDGKKVQTLFRNIKLLEKLEAKNRAEDVMNRSELRIMKNDFGDTRFDIQRHFEEAPEGYEIIHSIQAGPMIYPELKAEKESFIKYDAKGNIISLGADVFKKRERTVIGLKKNALGKYSYLYIIIFTKDHKVTLSEVKDYCENLGLDKALNLDGGASTSINYKDTELFSATDVQRCVKSFLVIEK